MLKIIRKIFAVGYSGIIVLFILCALSLIFFAALELWHGVNPSATLPLRDRFNSVLESIGLLTIAVVALELGQTILEEEVQREVQVSAPTRVRRFLSRFMVVVVVALATERTSVSAHATFHRGYVFGLEFPRSVATYDKDAFEVRGAAFGSPKRSYTGAIDSQEHCDSAT